MAGRNITMPREACCTGPASRLIASASPASERISYTGMCAVVALLSSTLLVIVNRRCPAHV
eukprot:11643360-Alexandrium_andersonii.AAC.1